MIILRDECIGHGHIPVNSRKSIRSFLNLRRGNSVLPDIL